MRKVNSVLFLFLLLSTVFMVGCKDKDAVEEKPIKTLEEQWCDDSCVFALDGECDDGGPDAKTNYCGLGTDCSDCETRVIIYVED